MRILLSLSLSLSISLSTLYPIHPSLSLSLSLSLFLFRSLSYLSLPLYISPSTFLSLPLLLSLFSLSFSLAYLMDVFELVDMIPLQILCYKLCHLNIKESYKKMLFYVDKIEINICNNEGRSGYC